MTPRMRALSTVGSIVIVWTMSAMIRISETQQDGPADVPAGPTVQSRSITLRVCGRGAHDCPQRTGREHDDTGDLEASDHPFHRAMEVHEPLLPGSSHDR